ncbi:sugar ABC transporter permease [Chloroflexi bacterium TSY]|nr:sugar ABC transporter permease [Chloroflexi bacterium TSY]
MATISSTEQRSGLSSRFGGNKRPMRQATREALYGYLLASPWILGFIVFTAGPMIASLYIGMFRTDFLTEWTFIGFKWYQNVFTDTLVRKALINTAIFSFSVVPINTALALMIAVMLNQGIRFQSFWRTVYYLPSVVSGVAVALLWKWLYQPDIGLLNSILGPLLRPFDIAPPRWIFSQEWALPSIIFMAFWGAGGAMLIYLAGLRGIPTSLYEAAEIDGASSFRRFFAITLPLLTPTIFFNVVLNIIGSWQVFTQALVMTRGGPNNATLTMVLHIYNTGFQNFYFGYASAQAWLLFLIVLIFVILALRSASSWVHYERV